MIQNIDFDTDLPRVQTIVMGSNPSTNIAYLLHEELIRQFGVGGCAPEGSEPLCDPDVFLFPKIEEAPISSDDIWLLERYLTAEAA
jgi:hypothetical protein